MKREQRRAPPNKGDWRDYVQSIIEDDKSGDPDALMTLLRCLRNINWPGAAEAAGYLASTGERSYELVVKMLKCEDDLFWQHHVIGHLITGWPRELQLKIVPLLKEIARRPIRNHNVPLLDVSTTEMLGDCKVLDPDEMRALASEVMANNEGYLDEIDWNELNEYLQ